MHGNSVHVCTVRDLKHTSSVRHASPTTTRTDLSHMLTCHTLYISAPPVETEVLRIEDTSPTKPDVVQNALRNTTRNVRPVHARPMMSAHTWGDIDCAVTLVPSQTLPQRCAANVDPTSLFHRCGNGWVDNRVTTQHRSPRTFAPMQTCKPTRSCSPRVQP